MPTISESSGSLGLKDVAPDIDQRFASAGAVPRFMGSAALEACEEAEIKKWGEAIRFSGARID